MELKDLPSEVKDFARGQYLGNEIGSDEYRDSQPMSGLNAAEAFFSNTGATMTGGLTPTQLEMVAAIRDWCSAIIADAENVVIEPTQHGYNLASNMYPGVDALEPILVKSFDAMWDANLHPYGKTADELLDDFNDEKMRVIFENATTAKEYAPATIISIREEGIILARDGFNEVRAIRWFMVTNPEIGKVIDLANVPSLPTNQLGSIIGA